MFLGQGGQYNDASSCWNSMSFSFKFYFLTSLGIFVGSIIYPLCFLLMDIPQFTIDNLHLWNPFFAFWGNIPSPIAIINILFAFLWMMRMMEVIDWNILGSEKIYSVFPIRGISNKFENSSDLHSGFCSFINNGSTRFGGLWIFPYNLGLWVLRRKGRSISFKKILLFAFYDQRKTLSMGYCRFPTHSLHAICMYPLCCVFGVYGGFCLEEDYWLSSKSLCRLIKDPSIKYQK